MSKTPTHLKREFKEMLADVGGLRAEDRLQLNQQLTDLLSSFNKLDNQVNLEPAQLDAFKAQLSSFRKDVARYDDHQQAYYPSPQSSRNGARQ